MTYELDLTGRRALVTGAGQGVGRGIALAMAAAGAEVIVNDFLLDRATTVVGEIEAAEGAALAAPFDVTDYAAVTDSIESLGGVNILVNNAGNAGTEGWTGSAYFVDTQPSDWDKFLQVNLFGVLYCTRAALPSMIAEGWGRVITVSSDSARAGGRKTAVYAAAKAGAAGLTRSVALEVGRYGITVNNISCGSMRTPATDAFFADESNPAVGELLKHYAVRRPGSPDDVGALATFLASPRASWITGQTYPLNGGFTFSL